MFGSHFYHATVRKSVAVFGTLFNNILVARKKGDGSIINQIKVPLAYGPKQKFLSRIDSDTGQDASVAIKLPRMSFEITGIELDTSKKLQKRSSINEPTSSTVTTSTIETFAEIGDFGNTTQITISSPGGVKNVSTYFGLFGYDGATLNFDNITQMSILTVTAGADFPYDNTSTRTNPTNKVLALFLPDTFTEGQDAGTINPTGTVYKVGGLTLKVSDAMYIDIDHVAWVADNVYYWSLTQTQMDTLYDNAIGAVDGGATGYFEQSWGQTVTTPATAITSRRSIKQQVPYNINMQLNIMAKNQDDGLQILEQILPYFQPEYTLSIKPIDEMPSFKQDVPIILNSVSFDDQYEGDFNSRRVLIYTLDFTMKMSFYGSLVNPKVIREINIDFVEDRTFGAVINLPAASAQLSYPTLFVPGATIYQGSNASRTWESTIDSLTSTQIRLFENNTTGYIAGARLYVTTGGVTQNIEAANNSITLRTDLNTLAELDVKIGLTDIETDYTLTTTFTTSDFE